MKRFMFLISFIFIFVSLTAQEAPAQEAPKADENQPAAEQAAPAEEAPAAEQAAPAEEPAKEEAPAEQAAPAEEPAKEEAPAEQAAPAEEPAKEEAPAADATAEAPAENNCPACPACDAPAEEAPVADPHHFIYFKPQISASYTHNRYVAGKADGHYFQADANIVLNYKYKKDMHEVLTDLNWKEGASYTPAFDGWVIANDLFKVDFRYNLMFHKIAGYYLKAGLETHFLPGYDYRSDEMTYQDQDGVEREKGVKKYKTAKPGKPFYLNEGTGIFVRPVEEESANLEIYAGLAGREVFVGDESYVVSDVDGDLATLKLLDDVYELGGEAGLLLKGYLHKRVLSYDLTSRVIMPFVFDKDTYRDSKGEFKYSDAIQFETRFRLDVSVHEYVAFNYELNVKRDFSTIRDWQISNALYLSVFYELDKRFN